MDSETYLECIHHCSDHHSWKINNHFQKTTNMCFVFGMAAEEFIAPLQLSICKGSRIS